MPPRTGTLALLPLALALAPSAPAQNLPADSAAAVATVAAFHAALSRGDSVTAIDLLSADALIVESGAIETLEEYRTGHLPSDIEFASATSSARRLVRVTVAGHVAWVVSSTATTGSFRDRPVNSTTAELMILGKRAGGWHIRAIHWSSRRR